MSPTSRQDMMIAEDQHAEYQAYTNERAEADEPALRFDEYFERKARMEAVVAARQAARFLPVENDICF
jgi:hypothetical protein